MYKRFHIFSWGLIYSELLLRSFLSSIMSCTSSTEEMAAWPMPNYDHPETRRPLVFGIGATALAIVLITVSVRFYSRALLVKAVGVVG